MLARAFSLTSLVSSLVSLVSLASVAVSAQLVAVSAADLQPAASPAALAALAPFADPPAPCSNASSPFTRASPAALALGFPSPCHYLWHIVPADFDSLAAAHAADVAAAATPPALDAVHADALTHHAGTTTCVPDTDPLDFARRSHPASATTAAPLAAPLAPLPHMHHHGSPLNRPESATPRETLAKREMPETAQQKHPRSSLVFHLAFNTAGSVLVMTAIAYVIQYCQDTLAAHPDAFPRFPILRSPAAPRPNPLTCFAGMAVLFGIAMAVMGITISNPLPSSIASYLGRLALTVMVYDLGIYIVHSMQHTVPAAIQFHKIHHRVPLFAWDVINADHADFLEAFLPILIVPWLFSFNIVEVWVLTFVLEVHGAITHSGCSIPALDKLDFVLVGPRFHAVHHVMHKNNYGVLFTLWDQIFGTAVPVAEADQRLWRRASSDTVPSM